MSFAAHHDRLQTRLRTLRKAEIAAWIAAVALTIVGAQFVPAGVAGGMAFTDVHVPVLALDQLTSMGMQIEENRGRVSAAGGLLAGLVMAGQLVLGILCVGALFRLNARWFLIFLVSNFILGGMGTGLRDAGRVTYKYASQKEFGIGVNNPDGPDAHEWEKRSRDTQLRRIAQGATFRAMMDGRPPGSAEQAANLAYVAAQVAYIQQDPVRTALRLNDLTMPAFIGHGVADQRVRQMQAYVQAHGLAIRPTAYRPLTGIPLPALDLMAKVLMWIGSLAFVAGIVLSGLNQNIRRRLKRVAAMMEQLKPARIAAVTRSGGFGARGLGPQAAG